MILLLALTCYRYASELHEDGEASEAVDLEAGSKDDTISRQDLHSSRDIPFSRSWIDREYTDYGSNPRVRLSISLHGSPTQIHTSTQVRNGVKLGEGDGTVSLLSLGAMCVEGWKRKRWNPAGIKVITVEVRVATNFVRRNSVFLNR